LSIFGFQCGYGGSSTCSLYTATGEAEHGKEYR
jgi:hypothetical protein